MPPAYRLIVSTEETIRKRSALLRIEEAVGAALGLPTRGPVVLPSGRRVYLTYAKGHHRAADVTYWFGIPRDAVADDLLVLLLGDVDLVLTVADMTTAEQHMTRSADGRLTPYVVEANGVFEQRVPAVGLVIPLNQYRDAYVRCR